MPYASSRASILTIKISSNVSSPNEKHAAGTTKMITSVGGEKPLSQESNAFSGLWHPHLLQISLPLSPGHISLDSISEYEDPKQELARPDKSLLTISTFFVLPEFQGQGLGGQAMRQAENLAREEPYGHPRCSAIAIMSLSCQYAEDPILRARFIEWTGKTPSSYERWYARMGYVKWKEEACTKIIVPGGESIMLVEAFMK